MGTLIRRTDTQAGAEDMKRPLANEMTDAEEAGIKPLSALSAELSWPGHGGPGNGGQMCIGAGLGGMSVPGGQEGFMSAIAAMPSGMDLPLPETAMEPGPWRKLPTCHGAPPRKRSRSRPHSRPHYRSHSRCCPLPDYHYRAHPLLPFTVPLALAPALALALAHIDLQTGLRHHPSHRPLSPGAMLLGGTPHMVEAQGQRVCPACNTACRQVPFAVSTAPHA